MPKQLTKIEDEHRGIWHDPEQLLPPERVDVYVWNGHYVEQAALSTKFGWNDPCMARVDVKAWYVIPKPPENLR